MTMSEAGRRVTGLERSYRRLLRVYPVAHRAAYEEEMVGVLMEGSPPGRRRPAPADVVDVLRAGLSARLGIGPFTGTPWRESAAVLGFLLALAVAATTALELVEQLLVMDDIEPPGTRWGLLDPILRTLAWTAVCVVAWRRRRGGRAAVWLSVVAVLADVLEPVWAAFVPLDGPVEKWTMLAAGEWLRMLLRPAPELLIVALFVAALTAVPPRVLLGRPGAWWIGAGTAMSVTAELLLWGGAVPSDAGLPAGIGEVLTFWIPLALVAVGILETPMPVRRRIVALALMLLAGFLVLAYLSDAFRIQGIFVGAMVALAVLVHYRPRPEATF